jgi:hypothetical protein
MAPCFWGHMRGDPNSAIPTLWGSARSAFHAKSRVGWSSAVQGKREVASGRCPGLPRVNQLTLR